MLLVLLAHLLTLSIGLLLGLAARSLAGTRQDAWGPWGDHGAARRAWWWLLERGVQLLQAMACALGHAQPSDAGGPPEGAAGGGDSPMVGAWPAKGTAAGCTAPPKCTAPLPCVAPPERTTPSKSTAPHGAKAAQEEGAAQSQQQGAATTLLDVFHVGQPVIVAAVLRSLGWAHQQHSLGATCRTIRDACLAAASRIAVTSQLPSSSRAGGQLKAYPWLRLVQRCPAVRSLIFRGRSCFAGDFWHPIVTAPRPTGLIHDAQTLASLLSALQEAGSTLDCLDVCACTNCDRRLTVAAFSAVNTRLGALCPQLRTLRLRGFALLPGLACAAPPMAQLQQLDLACMPAGVTAVLSRQDTLRSLAALRSIRLSMFNSSRAPPNSSMAYETLFGRRRVSETWAWVAQLRQLKRFEIDLEPTTARWQDTFEAGQELINALAGLPALQTLKLVRIRAPPPAGSPTGGSEVMSYQLPLPAQRFPSLLCWHLVGSEHLLSALPHAGGRVAPPKAGRRPLRCGYVWTRSLE